MDNIISDEEIKNIINTILLDEGFKDNLNIIVTNKKEYYKSLFSNKIKGFSDIMLLPFLANGVSNMKNDVLLFKDNIFNDCNKEDAIYRLVEVIYHELRHTKQLNFDKYSYEGLFVEVDTYLRMYKNYFFNHNLYYFEIDAFSYSMHKTELFLKNNYPDIYDKFKSDIKRRKDNYNNDMFLFDPINKLNDFIGLYRYNKYHLKNDKKLDEMSSIFGIFLDNKMNFKNINEIINNEKFKELDKRVIYSFFSLDIFLDSVDLDSLTKEELNIITESLMYTKGLYLEQLLKIDKYFIDKKEKAVKYLKIHKSLIKRIDYIYCFIKSYFFNGVFFVDNSRNKKRLLKKIDKVIIE